jgi:tRNA(Ile)-lysidine synthase
MLLTQLRNRLDNSPIIAAGDHILIAFSGGPDSTALLQALFELQSEFEFTLCAAHLNHMLRGSAADADQLWCAEFCRSLGVTFRSKRLDVNAEQQLRGGNLEEIAREIRYNFLQETADELSANRIAVAHSQDDQAETVLMRLLRGAGSSGLRGMRQMRGNIIRPMLDISRQSIEEYLQDHNIAARQDESNKDEKFSRVFVRRSLMPLIKELNPAAASTLCNTAEILAAEDDLLNEMADSLLPELTSSDNDQLSLSIEPFIMLPLALQRRVLRRALLHLLGSLRTITSTQVENFRLVLHGEIPDIEISGYCTSNDGQHVILKRREILPEISYSYQATIGEELEVKEVDKSFSLRIIETTEGFDFRGFSSHNRAFLDADKVDELIEVRNWLPGDRYSPFGLGGSQKLQDLFVNAKVSAEKKSYLPIFIAASGICWVYGFRIGNEFKITESTQRILSIEEV